MTTVPLGEAEATSKLPDGSPQASLGSADSWQGEPQNPDTLPADVPPQQEVGQASSKTDTSIAKSVSGDRDGTSDAPGNSQEGPEESTAPLAQGTSALQVFVGFQNPVWENNLAENTQTQSPTVPLSNSQENNVSEQQQEVAPPAPNAKVPTAHPEDVQLSVAAANSTTEDASGSDLQPTDVTKTDEQKAEGSLNLDSSAGSSLGTGEDLAEDSRVPPSPPFPSPPVSLNRTVLDPNLYSANEETDYMRSMTSLLGGGENSISSLADVLVWTDTAMGMGLALGLLASGRSAPTDLLQDEGANLRSISSILDNAREALVSGVASATSSVLRSINNLLHSTERRTIEGIRSAVRYLTSRLNPRWTRSSQDPD